MPPRPRLAKAPTGIAGLDEITGGGLPRGRPTLVCGAAGCGKTMLAAEFLVRGAARVRRARRLHDVRGERRGAGRQRALARLRPRRAAGADGKVAVDYVHVERSEIEETGEYDLEGLFIRLRPRDRHASAPSASCSTRIEALFAGLPQPRHPARRAAPAVPLAQGPRHDRGDHRRARREHAHALRPRGVRRRLRDPARPPHRRPGLDAAAARRQVPRLGARHQRVPVPDRLERASRCCRSRRCGSTTRRPTERVPHRHRRPRRDARRRGRLPRQQRAGLGLARHRQEQRRRAASRDAACARGERALLFAYEESASQLLRNMRSIGIDLGALGRARACCGSTPRGRRCTAWSSTWCRCTTLVREFKPGGRGRRPDQQPDARARRPRAQADADAADRLPQAAGRSPRCSRA